MSQYMPHACRNVVTTQLYRVSSEKCLGGTSFSCVVTVFTMYSNSGFLNSCGGKTGFLYGREAFPVPTNRMKP